ncbi:SIMPL domain-containing protein [Sphingobium sp. DEHP117]|uniref:SIMPL domain-containing protein n=1 Tax=Sphingobium sp. DEHP117 TaxID=2993436 RepID=UPI0027D4F45F|nr:SIMPL domain-containing protein [Sphingobium sp. DEHP117]MDQ4419052.1 SIMPL domain-containing protein [Sphingobium sp. DEHP117]
MPKARTYLPLALMFAAAAPLPLAAQAQMPSVTAQSQTPLLTLNITENIEAKPDLAMIGVGVQSNALTAVQALRANSTQMNAVIAAAKAKGVAAKDIQTSGFSLNPQYDYRDGQSVFKGYQVSNMVTIKTRDIENLGAFLDAMVANGGNTINGPTFSVENPEPLLVQARQRALASGAAQAQFYARGAGYSTARLVSISEAMNYSRPVDAMAPRPVVAQMAKAEVANVEPGQVSNGVTVTLQYVLER